MFSLRVSGFPGFSCTGIKQKSWEGQGEIMLIGYARVSTAGQSLDLQLDALRAAGCEKIFHDQVGGAKSDRPGLEEALGYIRNGDALIVWRLDRLGRSLKHLMETVGKLESKGIGFRSITESIDTTTIGGRLIFHIFAALAEFERNLIKERVNAGLESARARGRYGGRPQKLNKTKADLARKLYTEKQHTIGQICDMLAISPPTLYAYLKKTN